MAEPRYVIIHGHFYQPPRESPWTGLTSPEHGAAPFQNWNERILSECYTANAHAHAMEGSVVHVRNNYETLNFDLGPTLAAWLQTHGKTAYRAMTRGDALSAERHGGRGNAIAQSYNHSILPLLTPRDRELQLAWGVEDFVYRFGHKPAGMWLPECAADDDTLAAVAGAGLEFIILGADQGLFSGVGADNRSAGPFMWRGGERSIAVFRFDRELSNAISFGEGLGDGARLAEWIAATALSFEPGAALMLATDGETFGHHHKHGAAELARALIMLERRDDLVLTNCADYLAAHPAEGSFEMRSASAWSCPHGVERWRSNCGCRLDPNTSQEWRGPFRSAMEFVNNHVELTYDRFAPALTKEHQAALRDGIRLLVDPNPAVHDEMFRRFKVAEPNRETFLRLLEMVRAGQASLTSCAWYFDDFAGLEGRVALRWAARAVELASGNSASIESELLERLREIHSNRRENGDAATLYLSLKTREARSRV
jgi:alpha-amylase/alpha-mannosidase (GH57 family)